MNSTEVQNPRRKLYDKCLCLSHVFGSVLACNCKVCSRVSEALLLALLSLSLTNNYSSDSKVFLRCNAFSGSPTAVHCPLRCYAVGIPFWNTHRSHKRLSSMEKTQCRVLITHIHYVRVTERYTETLHGITNPTMLVRSRCVPPSIPSLF